MNVRESVMQIGQPTPLMGILTETDDRQSTTALILLNSGIMHRVGSCRLSVRLARAVASQTGIPCLRFDFSGVGDSAPRRAGGASFDEAAVSEVIEAMDHLANTRGIRNFIIYGLCSGASIACNTAERDSRVVGIVQLDGYCYPTTRAWLRHYGSRLFSTAAWRSRLSRWTGARWLANNPAQGGQGSILTGARKDFEVPEFADDPGRDAIAVQLQNLMDKKIFLYCVFTGRNPHYRYRQQFRHCFHDVNFGDKLSLEYYPRASHIFTEPAYQQAMMDGVVKWIADLEGIRLSQHAGRKKSVKTSLREAST
ncbi:hypothetical protein F6455_14630 [Proteobacteria bacterium 005FR1]|nr:hypothetical protein [Proteobacteria bacterium 005FR1]